MHQDQTQKPQQAPTVLGATPSFVPERLIVSAEVRYWEDAKINGEQDTEDGDNIPLKESDLWKPVIELATGRVLEWPEGIRADIHYKVCDQGEYWLEDSGVSVSFLYDDSKVASS
jgi:hypothetical protein